MNSDSPPKDIYLKIIIGKNVENIANVKTSSSCGTE